MGSALEIRNYACGVDCGDRVPNKNIIVPASVKELYQKAEVKLINNMQNAKI